MRVLSNNEFKTFEQLVSLTQKELHAAMATFLKSKYNNVIVNDKYICAKGDIPIALVAHMDTVFKTPAYEVYYDPRRNVMWSPDGLGADDRAGVYAIVEIIRSGLRPHVIFTTDEEMGCIGADELAKYQCPFEDLKYIIQLDRQGANDCVFYDCYNPAFIDYIESFGFVESWGTFSDISSLCPAWRICGVNLSVGYYGEHSFSEYLCVGQLFETIKKVKVMLQEEEIPEFEYKRMHRSHFNYLLKDYYSTEDPYVICGGCGHTYGEYDTFPVKGIDGGTKYYCIDCIPGRVDWCVNCEEAFELDPDCPNTLCPDCVEVFYSGDN